MHGNERKEMNFDLSSFGKKDDKQKNIPLGEIILVDLMPPSHKAVVNLRHLKKQWMFGLFGVVAFCIAASIAAVGLNATAQGELRTEMNTQGIITQDTATFAEVNRALEQQKISVQSLDLAAGSEIDWIKLISNIENNLPGGTQISAISVTGGGVKPKTEKDPDVAAVINLNLSSGHTIGYTDSLRMIEYMNGVESVEISGLQTSGERFTYTLSFTYDTSLLTERFSLKEDK
jgi:hypothetical protein